MTKHHHLLLALLLATPAPGCGWWKAKAAKDEHEDSAAGDDDDSAEEDDRVAVRVAALARGPITERVATSATVDARQRADVLVETAGTVESIAVEEGALVEAGQTLATLRNPQLKTELERATAAYERAQSEHAALVGLVDKGFVAKNDLDAAAHALQTARLTVQQAEAAYAAARLTTPIRGTVSLRDLRFGEAVAPPKLAFQVVDLARLEVDLMLPERDLARVREGQEARVRSAVHGDAGFGGRVLRISPVVDPRTGTVKVTVALDPEQSALRPGMFVNVDVVVDTRPDALLLPKRALAYAEGKPYVFVVQGEGDAAMATRRPVELGYAEEDRVELRSGAEAGERVIVVGHTTLRDGAKVRIREDLTAGTAPESAPL